MQFEDYALKLNASDFASRPKAKAKSQRRTLPGHPQKLYLSGKELGPILNHKIIRSPTTQCQRNWSILFVMVVYLEKMMEPMISGEWKIVFGTNLRTLKRWSDEMWKSTMAKSGGNKKRFRYCTDPSRQEILYFRALQGHSVRNLIDPSLQDNVLIPNDFFEYIYHVGYTGRTKFWAKDSQYSSCLWILWTKNTKILGQSTWKHRVLHNTCRQRGRNNTLPACCIPKAIKIGTGEIINEKVYESPRPPPKISCKDSWMKKLGPEVAGHDESSQQTQPKTPNPNVRMGRLVATEPPPRSSAQEIDTRFSLDCENTNLFVQRSEKDKDTDKDVDADRVRTESPAGSEQSTGSSTPFEEVDIDFRVFGLPHAVVKQAENFRVRELVKKIESHPHRQALEADLQQSDLGNPFSEDQRRWFRTWAM